MSAPRPPHAGGGEREPDVRVADPVSGSPPTPPSGARPPRGWAVVAMAAVALVVLAVAAGVLVLRRPAPPVPPRADYGAAPRYTLTDQNGRPFSSADLDGRIQVVSYLFPYCTSFCPLLTASLVQARDQLRAAGLDGEVAFVAFNVDPEAAGPATLAAYLRQEGIDPADPAWHFLTGTPQQIRTVVTDGFHVFYRKISLAEEESIEASARAAGDFTPQPSAPNPLADRAGPDYDVVHNDVVEIVDARGTVRALLSGDSAPTPEQIVAAVRAARGDAP